MTRPFARWSAGVSLLLLAALVTAFTGCETPGGMVQLSPDKYRLTLQQRGNEEANGKEQAISQAMHFAEAKGKVAVPVSIEEHGYGLFADWVRVEYEFRVVDKNDPRANRPSANDAEKAPDVYDELAKIDALRKKGILTQAEFEAEKKRLLAR